jgi:hypothetical protein
MSFVKSDILLLLLLLIFLRRSSSTSYETMALEAEISYRMSGVKEPSCACTRLVSFLPPFHRFTDLSSSTLSASSRMRVLLKNDFSTILRLNLSTGTMIGRMLGCSERFSTFKAQRAGRGFLPDSMHSSIPIQRMISTRTLYSTSPST